MGSDLEIDTVNPYDPPERQALEQHLQDDTHLLHETHQVIQQEQHLADDAQAAGYGHTQSDARIQQLEATEHIMGGKVVDDQQAIDHWDHANPGWDQPAASAGDGSDPAGDTSGYGDYPEQDGGDVPA
jgi:hypothetical protein